MEEVMQQSISSKKRKLLSELENQYFGDVNFLENSASQEESRISLCNKQDDVVKERNIDLQSEGCENEISKSNFSREKTPTSELCGDSDEVLTYSSSTLTEKLLKTVTVHRRKPAAGKIPSAAELEEFFSAAEKYEQKQFAEKYNYDIALDVPLEGRYKWEVCNLQP
ncbi:cyclin-dependent kinase inhibitor 7-like isoform X2 [Olea europaea subsp. europaea]|uniref:Cyclin-dependent kinase inhibitor 7-like isoform X2 n=1 Tax=Olea europaea subsp. europaea TaxID=158383 RepID=A0A8S0TDA1_OLEEU|nr:cyclin-dependent kinase inhibitor 7-like isoform X2 [Olea europaea subsp. europaea]